jgi:cobalt-zinc-cadmium efflux system membrane fusion protein
MTATVSTPIRKRLQAVAAIATAAWLAAGCFDRGGSDSSREHHDHDEDVHEANGAAGEDSGLLRIASDMLRDLRITTAPAEVRPASEGVSALGEIHVNEDAYAEVGLLIPARVVDVLATAGEAVARGQPLARLQSVELGRARSTYRSAAAAAKLAERTLQRMRQLAEQRIVPLREVQNAEAAEAAAQAELEAAKGALSALGIGSDDEEQGEISVFTLMAPIAGTLIERNAVRGRAVDPAVPLFRIADLSRLWLIVHSFERDAPRVQAGAQARVMLPALPGRSFSGTVDLIGALVDARSRTVPIRVVLENSEGFFLPGMSATAWLPLGGEKGSVTAVPTAAVQRLEDHWVVFVPAGAGAFEVRPIGRGRDLGGEIEILSGLRPGETIVVDGAFLLRAEAEKAHGAGGHHHH